MWEYKKNEKTARGEAGRFLGWGGIYLCIKQEMDIGIPPINKNGTA